jgi:chemotaxis protein CheD
VRAETVRYVVGVADMKVARETDDLVITHALGSCLGISIHDPVAGVGGIFHVMLPNASVSPEKAAANPYMFVDTGTPLFFKEAYAAGASKERLKVKVAGGAALGSGEDFFAIGKRNFVTLRKLFWKNSILIAAEDVGGTISRTMSLHVGTGRTWLQSGGKEWDI